MLVILITFMICYFLRAKRKQIADNEASVMKIKEKIARLVAENEEITRQKRAIEKEIDPLRRAKLQFENVSSFFHLITSPNIPTTCFH